MYVRLFITSELKWVLKCVVSQSRHRMTERSAVVAKICSIQAKLESKSSSYVQTLPQLLTCSPWSRPGKIIQVNTVKKEKEKKNSLKNKLLVLLLQSREMLWMAIFPTKLSLLCHGTPTGTWSVFRDPTKSQCWVILSRQSLVIFSQVKGFSHGERLTPCNSFSMRSERKGARRIQSTRRSEKRV